MGEGASGTTRVGYVWLEFRFSGGVDRWFCCGARLQASTHTSTVHADYFTTELRIGRPGGLSLLTDAGQPLTKSVLQERLGECGTLHLRNVICREHDGVPRGAPFVARA